MTNIAAIKDSLSAGWANLRGWRTPRRLVVFESDDWGAIRMPGTEAHKALSELGLGVNDNPYDRLDCLENGSDLGALFDVIEKHRDSTGRPATFTFNTIMGNPDFPAIENNGFESYERESFFESYDKYNGEDLKEAWQAAMDERLIWPQFHGREHVNVGLWLADLQRNNPATLCAFEHGYYGLTTQTSAPDQRDYLAANWPTSISHMQDITRIVEHGLAEFRSVFGYPSRSLIACNYILPAELEATIWDLGVRLIQGQRGQLRPSADGKTVAVHRRFTGKRSEVNQIYTVRNVKFEPFENEGSDWVASAIGQIRSAFAMHKPAIISTHRVNYVGGMSMAHRDRSLRLLDDLIGTALRNWPDLEFVTSDDLIDAICD